MGVRQGKRQANGGVHQKEKKMEGGEEETLTKADFEPLHYFSPLKLQTCHCLRELPSFR